MNKFTYEEKYHELEELLNRSRFRWQLDAITWMDYDDVCQTIRLHIFNKWHLWDQERSFKPWAAQIISNQIKNLVRNHYSNYAKPCFKCPNFLGNDGCAITKNQIQSPECDIFAKWQKKKERVYNLKLPLPIDDTIFLGETFMGDNFDYEHSRDKLHVMIMDRLSDKHKQIYSMLYIEHIPEEQVAKAFNFKGDSSKRKTIRYKQISNLQKKFYSMAIEIIKNNDIL